MSISKIERLEAEIERWKKELRLSTSCEAKYRREMLDDISEFIDSLPEEPVSEDLEKAVEEHRKYLDYWGMACGYKDASCEGFKKGANWRKEQMMKDAIPAKVVNDEYSGCVVDCDNGCLVMPRHAYNFTDKLKIIIVKEEENESN